MSVDSFNIHSLDHSFSRSVCLPLIRFIYRKWFAALLDQLMPFLLLAWSSIISTNTNMILMSNSRKNPTGNLSAVLPGPVHLRGKEKTQFCVLSSLAGVFALAAVPHVLGVELHLDGDAVEPKFGVEQIGSFLQHHLGIGALLWSGMRKQGGFSVISVT